EWLILPDSCLATAKSLQLLHTVLKDLQIHEQTMLSNLERTQGFIFAEAVMLALAEKCGKQSAYSLIHEIAMQAQQQNKNFKTALLADNRITAFLSEAELNQLCDVQQCTGACAAMVEQVIERVS
ncbi:partial 3-carboxy-cis,cis-muconate cycloisomerase, partial [Anaerolineae bacterium]